MTHTDALSYLLGLGCIVSNGTLWNTDAILFLKSVTVAVANQRRIDNQCAYRLEELGRAVLVNSEVSLLLKADSGRALCSGVSYVARQYD